jgi:hypothetical protein
MICLTLALGGLGCGRKGDPIPRPRAAPGACIARWASLRTLEITLPLQDSQGDELVGVERVRVYFLPLGTSQPTAQDVMTKGEVILEKRRPDLPDPGKSLRLELKAVTRSAGWIVVTAVRVGDVVGAPSEVLVWLNPEI